MKNLKKQLLDLVKYFPRKIKKKLIGHLEEKIESMHLCTDAIVNMLVKKIMNNDKVQFYGQVNQDLIAYIFFGGKKDGSYIDIGAYDGVTGSNTYCFEQLGWTGVCVEPLSDIFLKLQKNRKCVCYNAAIAPESGNEMKFVRASNVETLSGLESEMTEAHKKRIKREAGKIEVINVKTLSFEDLMNNFNNGGGRGRFIDFMSIDVEGAEMSILKSIDFNKYSFGLITIENNEEKEGDGERLKSYMAEKGYRVFLDLGLDIMFTK
jgi:FkbM family methyltransferase